MSHSSEGITLFWQCQNPPRRIIRENPCFYPPQAGKSVASFMFFCGMAVNGFLKIAFSLESQIGAVDALCGKYQDVPMSLADACVVRMAELNPDCSVMTNVTRAFDSTENTCGM